MVERKPRIETERLILRMPEFGDVDEIIQYYTRNKKHLEGVEPLRTDEFYTNVYWKMVVVRFEENFENDRALSFFMFSKENPNRVIGGIGYSNFSRGVFQACNLGYHLSHECEGKGLMSEALKSSNQFIFEKLEFHRIMANYMPTNKRSAALLKRLGFSIEGTAKDYLKIRGKWEDHVLTSLINPNSSDQ